MTDATTGRCYCGAVRYELRGKQMWPGLCHCDVCRRFSGGRAGSWFGCKEDEIDLKGELSYYRYTADSGNIVRRGTCAVCRTPVCNQNSCMPDVLVIAAGTLDAPSAFKPRMELFCGKAPEWDPVDSTLKLFEGMPVPKDK